MSLQDRLPGVDHRSRAQGGSLGPGFAPQRGAIGAALTGDARQLRCRSSAAAIRLAMLSIAAASRPSIMMRASGSVPL